MKNHDLRTTYGSREPGPSSPEGSTSDSGCPPRIKGALIAAVPLCRAFDLALGTLGLALGNPNFALGGPEATLGGAARDLADLGPAGLPSCSTCGDAVATAGGPDVPSEAAKALAGGAPDDDASAAKPAFGGAALDL